MGIKSSTLWKVKHKKEMGGGGRLEKRIREEITLDVYFIEENMTATARTTVKIKGQEPVIPRYWILTDPNTLQKYNNGWSKAWSCLISCEAG